MQLNIYTNTCNCLSFVIVPIQDLAVERQRLKAQIEVLLSTILLKSLGKIQFLRDAIWFLD
jgi:hypothetical protein